MEDYHESEPVAPQSRSRHRRGGWGVRLTPGGLLLLMIFNLALLSLLAWPLIQARRSQGIPTSPISTTESALEPNSSATPLPSWTYTPTLLEPSRTPLPEIPTSAPQNIISLQKGLIVLALTEGDRSHLFAYQPQLDAETGSMLLSRLTAGPWDDLQPAISPDGTRLAFTSNRSGYWDLYTLDLVNGKVNRLTDTLAYDGSPSWSPDGLWIIYETYLDDNLEIMVQSVEDAQQSPIRLTSHPAADTSPVWSPLGRQVAFISDRSGDSEVWLVDLNQADEQLFVNLSHSADSRESHPVWSPDGSALAWASLKNGFHDIYIWDSKKPEAKPRIIGNGDWPAWSPDGQSLLAAVYAPNTHYLAAYPYQSTGLTLPMLRLPGFVEGLLWGDAELAQPLQEPFKQSALVTPTSLWLPALTPQVDIPGGRQHVVPLLDVQAPHPYLHDLVDEAFNALRARLALDAGWDFLASLENAYVPLTSPLDPGMGDDWLYTGRAFAVIRSPAQAGWLVVVREDFGYETYWRVFLRARYQDGSAGMPLHATPWNLAARFEGQPAFYEEGGQLEMVAPPGYWIDCTRLAAMYGWERIPALDSWRASLPAARYNEFVMTDGLDWQSAILDLYPPEVLITPSPVIPPTRTPTKTPYGYQTPTPTQTPTPRPTLTPLPPTATYTPTVTHTPAPTFTRTSLPSRTPTPTPTRTNVVPSRTPTPTATPNE
jgi:TolB protein